VVGARPLELRLLATCRRHRLLVLLVVSAAALDRSPHEVWHCSLDAKMMMMGYISANVHWGTYQQMCIGGEMDIMLRSRLFSNWLCGRVPWVMVAGAMGVPWE